MSSSASEYRDFIGETVQTFRYMTDMDSTEKSQTAQALARAIGKGTIKVSEAGIEHLIEGEEGVPNWFDAVEQLACKKDLHPLQAWMLGELVATAVVSIHELANVEPISDEQLYGLTDELVTISNLGR